MADSDKTNVVVAVDNSKHSDYAVNWYLEKLMRPSHHIIFVYVVPPFSPVYGGSGYMITPAIEIYAEETKRNIANVKEKMSELVKGKDVTSELVHESGDAGHQICHVAKERKASMIVVGTRGLGTIRRTILGSVSDYVVHHAHVPVTICHSPGH